MRIVFMGTPDFAVPSLKALIHGHQVVGIVTQPDKPKGRGHKLIFPPVKEVGVAYNIPVYQPQRIKDPSFLPQLKKLAADIYVVAAYGQILSGEILAQPPLGCINVHGSLLPKYRGASPIHHAIMNGETTTGITIMQMDTGLDTGDMLLRKAIPILPEDTAATMHDKLANLGAEALLAVLEKIADGTIQRKKQVAADSSYAPLLTKEMGLIRWKEPSENINNKVRGLNPWPGAYTFYNEDKIKIWQTGLVALPGMGGTPGEIISLADGAITVATGDGAIQILQVQGSNGKKMSAGDYTRGHKIETGARFTE